MPVQDPSAGTAGTATAVRPLYVYGVTWAAAAREEAAAGIGEADVSPVLSNGLAALTSPLLNPHVRARRREQLAPPSANVRVQERARQRREAVRQHWRDVRLADPGRRLLARSGRPGDAVDVERSHRGRGACCAGRGILHGHPLVASDALLRLARSALDLVLRAFECAPGLLPAAVAQVLEPDAARLREVEPVHGLREAEVGVDARDHDPGVDRQQLDPDDRDANVGVDHQALVEDQVEHVGEPARARRALEVVACSASCCDGHWVSLGRSRFLERLLPLLPAPAPLVTLLLASLVARRCFLLRLGRVCRAVRAALADPFGERRQRRRDAAAGLVGAGLEHFFQGSARAAPRLDRRLDPLLPERRSLPGEVGRGRGRARRGEWDERLPRHRPEEAFGEAVAPAPAGARALFVGHAFACASLLLRLGHFSSERLDSSWSPTRAAIPRAAAAAAPIAAAAAAPFAAVRRDELLGSSSSFTPSIFPSVTFCAPVCASSGRPASSVCVRSSRFTASAKRRYVSTLAITIRASIVSSSIPMTDTRMKASSTKPLSRMRSTTSASPLGLGAR